MYEKTKIKSNKKNIFQEAKLIKWKICIKQWKRKIRQYFVHGNKKDQKIGLFHLQIILILSIKSEKS